MSERVRLRPAHSPADLARIYARPHDHTRWADHLVRVAVTAQFAHQLCGRVARAADLSCGDGTILGALDVGERFFGDFAPGHEFTGPIEETLGQIPDVDLLICTETLEHLDDPDLVLKQARTKTRTLVLSTPVDAWHDDNLEHYWSWSRAGVEDMLRGAGFDPAVYCELDFRACGGVYSFGTFWAR